MPARSVAVIFGGLRMPRRSLKRFADVYEGRTTVVVPLTITCLAAGTRYTQYRALHAALGLQAAGAPLHIHALSASCHFIYRFISLYPEYRERVVSQVYDSPCSVSGGVSWLRAVYGVPPMLGHGLLRTALPDIFETSARWMEASVFARTIPTGVITSTRDAISPPEHIEAMVKSWDCARLVRMTTDATHLRSLRDSPDEYATFCTKIADEGQWVR
jgi:hypothetical protein